ncbi:hypothetical protein Leryth_015440 [Lithospermum erythrorhizon]|nr:hypothetical protein Leryth_015440 [Lithospermum erythrorhizon]
MMEKALLPEREKGEDVETRQPLIDELKKVTYIALPMIIVTVSQYLLRAAPVIMLGHIDELYLASSSIATSFCNVTGFSLILGMSSALETLCGQAYGAGQHKKLGSYTYCGIISLILVCIPVSILWIFIEDILIFVGQDVVISREAGNYAIWLILTLFPYAILQSLNRFLQTQSLILPMLLTSIISICFHLPVCWAFIFKLNLGNAGAALSIGLSYSLNTILLVLYVKYSPTCENTWVPFSADVFGKIGEFYRFAIPSAVMVCLNITSLHYFIPYSFAVAVSTRVSNELGAGNPQRARIALCVVVVLACSEFLLASAILFCFRFILGYGFSNEKEVVDYVRDITPLLCLSIIVDSIQTVLSGSSSQPILLFTYVFSSSFHEDATNVSLYSLGYILVIRIRCVERKWMAAYRGLHKSWFILYSRDSSILSVGVCFSFERTGALDRIVGGINNTSGSSFSHYMSLRLEKTDMSCGTFQKAQYLVLVLHILTRVKNSWFKVMEKALLQEKEEKHRAPTWNIFVEELRMTSCIALPMVIVTVSQQLSRVVSMMMVGHLGELELSGAAIATSLTNVLGFILFLFLDEALEFIGQDPQISGEAGRYAVYLIPTLFPYAILQLLIRYLQTQSLIMPMLLSSIASLLFHVPVCWLLVYRFDCGAAGAALAIGLSYWLNVILLGIYVKHSSACQKTRISFSIYDFPSIKEFFRLEWWSCEIVVLLSGTLPNPQLESSVMLTASLHYFIPFSIGAAASTRVSNELGAGNPIRAQVAVWAVSSLAVMEVLIATIVLICCRNILGYAFSNSKEVVSYIKDIIPLVSSNNVISCFHQSVTGVARGCGWQHLGAYVNLGAYYLVGIPVAILLGFALRLGGTGLWMGINAGSIVQVTLLSIVTSRTNWQKQASIVRGRIFEERDTAEK